ncbi:hypothetical protein CR513_61139, partial [Mucuna pruriens]
MRWKLWKGSNVGHPLPRWLSIAQSGGNFYQDFDIMYSTLASFSLSLLSKSLARVSNLRTNTFSAKLICNSVGTVTAYY